MNNQLFGLYTAPSTGSTQYVGLADHHRAAAATNLGTPFQFPGVLSKLRIAATTAPGAGKSYAVTVQKDTGSGFSDTSMVLVLDESNATASSTDNPVSFQAGDTLRLKIVPSGTPSAMGVMALGAQLDTTGAVSCIAGHALEALNQNSSRYLNPGGGDRSSAVADVAGTVKAAGTIRNLVVGVETAPGSGKSWTFTLYKNGSPTALACAIADTATRGADTTNAVSVAVGDLIALQSTPSGTPTSAYAGWSVEFDPDEEGRQLVLDSLTPGANSGTRYKKLSGSGADLTTENEGGGLLTKDCTVLDWGGSLISAPGAGTSIEFTLRERAVADTTASFSIQDTGTSSESTQDPALSEGDVIDVKVVYSNSPTTSRLRGGCVLYIAPPVVLAEVPGLQAPVVLVPRYSTYSGAHAFETTGLDVRRYVGATISVWRGALVGTSPTIAFTFEESSDHVNWTTCAGTSTGFDPGADTEAVYRPTFVKKWFRIRVVLGGTDPVATCWASGFFEERKGRRRRRRRRRPAQ